MCWFAPLVELFSMNKRLIYMRHLLLTLAFVTAGCEIRVIEGPPYDEEIIVIERRSPPRREIIVVEEHIRWCDDDFLPYNKYPNYCEEYWDGTCCEWGTSYGCAEVWCQVELYSCGWIWSLEEEWCWERI